MGRERRRDRREEGRDALANLVARPPGVLDGFVWNDVGKRPRVGILVAHRVSLRIQYSPWCPRRREHERGHMAKKTTRKVARTKRPPRGADKALSTGRSLAAEVLRFRDAALRKRTAAIRRAAPSRAAAMQVLAPG